MRTMMKTIDSRLSAGEALVLVTVIAASGATPRGAGARMLVGKEGRICGTIGGGAVEYRSIQLALETLKQQRSGMEDFTLTKDDVKNLGMICGGDVNVFFHYIPASDAGTIALTREAERQYAAGGNLWLVSDIQKGGELSLFTQDTAPQWLQPHMGRHAHRVREDGRDFFVEQIATSGRVYIFGGGHVAQELEPVLTHVGFRCVILEDRPEFARKELFPTAEQIMMVDFRKLDQYIHLTDTLQAVAVDMPLGSSMGASSLTSAATMLALQTTEMASISCRKLTPPASGVPVPGKTAQSRQSRSMVK